MNRLSAARESPPLWLWLNVLSLDAPIVALIWQDFLSRCIPSILRMPGRYVLGLTVWAIYIADRLIDVRSPPGGEETARHRFYRKNAIAAGLFLTLILAVDLVLALDELRPEVFLNGLPIGGIVLGYLLVFSLGRIQVRFWKQLAGAMLFTAGVFLVSWTTATRPDAIPNAMPLAFGSLCFGNLVLVESWEKHRPIRWFWLWLLALAAICGISGGSRWYGAIAVSAAGLALLDLCAARISAPELRGVLADLVLLSPLLIRQ